MKKNWIIAVAFILTFTHIIPPHNISFANDEINDCELMNFTVQTIKEDDKKISGTGQPSQKLEIAFKTKNKTEFIDANGKFELEIEEGLLELNDIITISNDYFKIETKVTSQGITTSPIKSDQYVECPIIEETNVDEIPEESLNTKDQKDEQSSEEVINSEKPSSNQEIEEEDNSELKLNKPTIDGASADGYTISGSAEAPEIIVILSDGAGNELNSTITDEDGIYMFSLPADKVEEGEILSLLSEDNAGNTGNEVTATVPIEVTTSPELGELAIDGDSTDGYDITGSSEPDATLAVINSDGDEVGSDTADDEGKFTMDVSADDVSPDEELSIIATDEAGNRSDASTVTVPVDPDVKDPVLSSADIEGNSNEGYLGVGAGEEPGDTVNFTNEAGTVVGTGPIDENGTYSFTLTGDFNPNEVLKVQAVDEVGNESNIIEVTVPADIIKIESLPDIIFNTTSITDEESLILRQSVNSSIKIRNTGRKGNWTLSASAEPLKNGNGHILSNALIYAKKNDEEASLENGSIPVATNEDATSEGTIDTIIWSENEGVLLRINPILAQAGSSYQSKITWTLTDGP